MAAHKKTACKTRQIVPLCAARHEQLNTQVQPEVCKWTSIYSCNWSLIVWAAEDDDEDDEEEVFEEKPKGEAASAVESTVEGAKVR